ncbi:MAG: diguanylate cyclase, partial [Bacillota bacterium]|nr:diguanylate cyclase [Bacillota bacterium]
SNITQLTEHMLPKKLTNQLSEKFNIGETVIAKITKDNKMLGDFTLMMPKDKSFNKFKIVEMYSNHIGLLIEKTKSEEKILELNKAYNEKSKILKTITDNMIDPIALTDVEGNFTYVGNSHSVLGYDLDSLIGKNVMELVHPDDFDFIKKRFSDFIAKRLKSEKVEYRIRCSDGTYLWWETIGNLIIEDDELKGIVFSSRDITEGKIHREKIKRLSYKDHLTGLYNRRYFESELKKLDTKSNFPLTIVMGDVNGLKLINDSFGHSVGDKLLINAAKIIKKSCREDDIIARIGGDEYAILLTQTTSDEVEKIIKRIKTHSKEKNIKGIEISISFGYASKTNNNETINQIFKKAEDKMYKNKLFESPSIRGKSIDNIVNAISSKSPREKEHSERVSEICVKIGETLGLEDYLLKELKIFGLFHDIGKIAIADNILNKAGTLNHNELEEVRRHSEIGYRILSAASGMSTIAEYVLAHHERWDGKGYPKGLKGKEIPLPSRICMIADAYDAMTSEGSYRSPVSVESALNNLKRHSRTQFDEKLVKIFINQVQPKL